MLNILNAVCLSYFWIQYRLFKYIFLSFSALNFQIYVVTYSISITDVLDVLEKTPGRRHPQGIRCVFVLSLFYYWITAFLTTWSFNIKWLKLVKPMFFIPFQYLEIIERRSPPVCRFTIQLILWKVRSPLNSVLDLFTFILSASSSFFF